MECKECEKKIPYFVAEELNDRDLKKFLEHVNECPECREELTIQVLISEGTARLEEGGAFDLQKEINKRMTAAENRIHMHKIFRAVRIVLGLAAVAAVVLLAVLFLL